MRTIRMEAHTISGHSISHSQLAIECMLGIMACKLDGEISHPVRITGSSTSTAAVFCERRLLASCVSIRTGMTTRASQTVVLRAEFLAVWPSMLVPPLSAEVSLREDHQCSEGNYPELTFACSLTTLGTVELEMDSHIDWR